MNIGIIGTGNMGNILIDAFLETRAVKPSCLTIINRTPAKAYHIKEKYPSVHIAKTIDKVNRTITSYFYLRKADRYISDPTKIC
ncbi:shikimate / quinate 5-dehydrogenase family protein [Bacillus anthracis]|nr:shikimate / quinate 5-dehydrogenase family protein [Bacillus anthracis]